MCESVGKGISPTRAASHDPLLPVLESALFAKSLIATLRLYPFALVLGVAFRLAPPSPRRSLSARLATAALGGQHLDRSQQSFTGRARRDHRIFLERQMHHASIARRHRIEAQRLMVALGLLTHRQRHLMQLLAASRAIRFSLPRNRRRILDSPRQDPIHDVLERVEGLSMPPDEESRTVALDFDLDRLRVHFYLPHFGPFAHGGRPPGCAPRAAGSLASLRPRG